MASPNLSDSNFGLFIAYILPGYTAMKGLPFFGSDFSHWALPLPYADSTIAGFLAGSVEALFAGLTVSLLRWFLVDTIHHSTGIEKPMWDFAKLDRKAQAFELLVQDHYVYYKFYANMVVALFWSFAVVQPRFGSSAIGYWVFTAMFFVGSRDSLKRYYGRVSTLMKSE